MKEDIGIEVSEGEGDSEPSREMALWEILCVWRGEVAFGRERRAWGGVRMKMRVKVGGIQQLA